MAAVRLPNLGPRARKVARIAGFALLGLVTFVLAFQLTFPFDRVKDKAVEVLSEKYDTTIGDVERGWIPGRMYFKAVSLRTRATKPGDVSTTFYVEQLEVDLGILSLLRGAASVDLDAKIGAGHIRGSIAASNSGTEIDFVGEDLPSVMLPTREVLGLPMSGKLRFAVALDLPNEKNKQGKTAPNWAKANGHVELACPTGCAVGDGKTKLKMALKNQRSQAFAEGGIDFGKVSLDSLLAVVELKNGKVDVTKFDAKSGDGELHVDFTMTLNAEVNQSLVAGCLRFRGSDGLLKREPKTHAALSTTGAPLGPDNLFHIKLDGPLREVRRLGQVCGASTNTSMDNPGARPSLSVPPPEPKPAAPSTPPAAAAPPPPAAPADAGVPIVDAHVAPPAQGQPQPEGDGNAAPPSPPPAPGSPPPGFFPPGTNPYPPPGEQPPPQQPH